MTTEANSNTAHVADEEFLGGMPQSRLDELVREGRPLLESERARAAVARPASEPSLAVGGWVPPTQPGFDSNGESVPDTGPSNGTAAADRVKPETHRAEALLSWSPVDLAAILAGGLDPVLPTDLLTRTDGAGLFYGEGRIHHTMGPPESFKTILAELAVARALLDGGRALYIVHDGDAADVVRHLLAFNVPPEALARLTVLQPDEPLSSPLDLGDFDITVIDGVDDAMALHGLNPDKGVEYRRWLQLEVRPLQRRTEGPLILIDHVAKNKEVRDGWPVGTGAKRAACDVALSFETVQDFGRGRTGMAKITLSKDRPGGLRAHQANGREIARLRLESHWPADEMITWELLPPVIATDSEGDLLGGRWQPTGLMERISRLLESATESLPKVAIERVSGKRQYVRAALAELIAQGYVEAYSGAKNAILHRSAKPFREAGS